ncbi:MAG TPA: hypothetical protein VGC56_13855 [Allosphingosinicella sp.]|jgi:hypothetical protein
MRESSSFYLSERITPGVLAAAIADFFGRPLAAVFAYDNASAMLDPLNPSGDGLSQLYLDSEVEVAIGYDDIGATGPLTGWFTIHGISIENDRVLTQWLARRLKQIMLYRDPVPHPKDHPEFESAQILVTPDVREFPVWWVGFAADDGDDQEVWLCDGRRELVRPLRRDDFARMLAGGDP